MDAVIPLYKPIGISSAHIVNRLKRILNVRKAGHAGTLDPLAEGVLVVGIGKGTKQLTNLMHTTKGYRATFKLGIATNTEDSEGDSILEKDATHIQEEDVHQALTQFIGETKQIPPMFSALKRNGQPLYKLARQGITVEREPRTITIEKIKLISFDNPIVRIDVTCSKGTYIRSLIRDIGDTLGVGAHMTALTRTRVGDYILKDTITCEDIENIGIPEHFLLEDETFHNTQ